MSGKGGRQASNLTKAHARGLKSLKRRIQEGEIIVIPTDESGNLAVMSLNTYVASGMKHTLKDMEVGWHDIRDSQKELNGHVSMFIKIFKIGAKWQKGTMD